MIDVRRAYFYAKARRTVYIELPEGDGGGPGSRQCGLLRKSLYVTRLYVTRDAAQNWECDDCESGTLSGALVNNDIHVPPSFAVEVVGDGEPSDSSWVFGSECGSVACRVCLWLLMWVGLLLLL